MCKCDEYEPIHVNVSLDGKVIVVKDERTIVRISTCENHGVCRSISNNYECLCLGESYSGRHCEIKSTRIVVLQWFARSISYIAILVIITCSLFIITMDILKYGFGIDPVPKGEKKTLQSKKPRKRQYVMMIHFIYVNTPAMNSSVDFNM